MTVPSIRLLTNICAAIESNAGGICNVTRELSYFSAQVNAENCYGSFSPRGAGPSDKSELSHRVESRIGNRMKILSQSPRNRDTYRIASGAVAFERNFNGTALFEFRHNCKHAIWRQSDNWSTLRPQPHRTKRRIAGIKTFAVDCDFRPRDSVRRINPDNSSLFGHLFGLIPCCGRSPKMLA